MEISIKWNVCRVCLREENEDKGDNSKRSGRMRDIFSTGNIAERIYECTGIEMKPDDSMPNKICADCLQMLKCAVHFNRTCRSSNDYLRTVVQKTKSASSMLNLEKRREDNLELTESLFNTAATDKQDENVEPEFHYEGESENEEVEEGKEQTLAIQQLDCHEEESEQAIEDKEIPPEEAEESRGPTATKSSITVNITKDEEPQQDMKEHEEKSSDELSEKSAMRRCLNANYIEELLDDDEQDFIENDLDDLEDRRGKNSLFQKSSSECSVEDDNYVDEGEEEHIDGVEIKNSDVRIKQENAKSTETIEMVTVSTSNPEDELFYVLKNEDCGVKQETDTFRGDECEGDVDDAEVNAVMRVCDDDDVARCVGIEERDEIIEESTVYEVIPAEEVCYIANDVDGAKKSCSSNIENIEYLIEDSPDKGDISLKIRQSSSLKIKVSNRRWSPHARKKPPPMYVCDICGNQFTSRSLMNYHMRVHRNDKNYECELCFKRFKAPCNLNAHMRTHTGEKPFECAYCQRRFTDRSTHLKHERIHTNEKPFQCKECGKSFSLSTSLRAHEKIHTGEKPYKCNPCNKSFKLPHQLKAHTNTQIHKFLALGQNA